jgi:hypothetical protein
MHKFYKWIGGSLLATMLLTGCANNDNDPPPEDDVDINEPRDNDVIDPDLDGDDNGNNIPDDDDTTGTGTTYDRNRVGDGDPAIDRNTPREDIIEDLDDMRDRDRIDR